MLTKKDNLKKEVKSSKNDKPATNSNMQPAIAPSQQPAKIYASQFTDQHHESYTDKKAHSKTRITVKYDVGFSNQLYIRGKGANLSWDKGQSMKNTKSDEWVWETEAHFTQCEFKVLLNDQNYEAGDNHSVKEGSCFVYTPHF